MKKIFAESGSSIFLDQFDYSQVRNLSLSSSLWS
jgi:hypothetical protein